MAGPSSAIAQIVGIGTTNPLQKLQVAGNVGVHPPGSAVTIAVMSDVNGTLINPGTLSNHAGLTNYDFPTN